MGFKEALIKVQLPLVLPFASAGGAREIYPSTATGTDHLAIPPIQQDFPDTEPGGTARVETPHMAELGSHP